MPPRVYKRKSSKKRSSRKVSFKRGTKYASRKKSSFRKKKSSSKKVKKVSSLKAKKPYVRRGANVNDYVKAAGKLVSRPYSMLKYGARGGMYGTALGTYLGPHSTVVGGAIGATAGAAYGLITGKGDYKMNSMLSTPDQVPSFDSNGRHCVRIKHREYVGDLTISSSAFLNATYQINPTSNLFPWLSTIASNFSEYRMEGMVVELKTISATATGSTNGAMGWWGIGTEYNAALPAFTSKQQMENSEFAVSGPPNSNLLHPIECMRQENVLGELYITPSGTTPAGSDPRLYNLGVLNIASGGAQAGYVSMELWVSYDICLYKPLLGYGSGYNVNTYHYHASTGIATTTAYFGSNGLVQVGSTFPVLQTLGTTLTLGANLDIGSYLLTYTVLGASTAGVVAPVVTYDGVTTQPLNLYSSSTYPDNTGVAGQNTVSTITSFFKLLQPSGVIVFSGGVFPGTITSMDLLITQINTNIIV